MEKLKLYEVTKSSSDKNIKVGDIIWISKNGDLNLQKKKAGSQKQRRCDYELY